ncbi:MAG: hypothetical protein JSV34_05465 [Candidatus Omnitrophota bacterium]|nr:MAG: hypothetical protein JSV34_05465 [Candidatus Omnitrophota bacterium]
MEIKLINTQKVLSPTQISLADYVINPYRGCEFNCLYCYGQFNKNTKGNKKSLGIKINAPVALERELKYRKPRRILFGSTTECFQYQELTYKISENLLSILNSRKIPYTILTKSHLIKNYLPLIARNPKNKIYFTLNCSSDKTINLLEEKSPSLEERLQAIREIIKWNISLRLHIGPFIPYISSFEDIMNIAPAQIREIDVELYHHKMGNFSEILRRIKKHLNTDTAKKLIHVYLNELNYLSFAKTLEETIKSEHRKKKYKCKVFYIVPDFNEFYKSSINYETELI